MEFNPNNDVVKRCIEAMAMEQQRKPEEATRLFMQAWSESTNDFERFIASYHVARHQENMLDKLKWLETSLDLALKVNDDSVNSALPSLYLNIAKCYEDLDEIENAKKHYASALSFAGKPRDLGPFCHGTRADLQVGDLLMPGFGSNYQPDIIMNHIYFTALANGAGLAAALAKGDGRQRVYEVEPTGNFENDPNVTDKKFPGNLTRSYRTQSSLKIIGEKTDWKKQTAEEIQQWHEKRATKIGKIIN